MPINQFNKLLKIGFIKAVLKPFLIKSKLFEYSKYN